MRSQIIKSKVNGSLNICAINLSIQGALHSQPCAGSVYEQAFSLAKVRGGVLHWTGRIDTQRYARAG